VESIAGLHRIRRDGSVEGHSFATRRSATRGEAARVAGRIEIGVVAPKGNWFGGELVSHGCNYRDPVGLGGLRPGGGAL